MASVGAGTPHPIRVMSLVGTAHFMSHVYFLALPPLFPLLLEEFDASYTALGFVLTAFAVASALAATPVGFVVDRLGARRVLIFGLALQSAAMGAVGLTSSYWALVALFVVSGLAFAVFHPADYAILSASVDESRMGRAFSFHAFTGNLGSAAAPMLMVTLAALWNWRGAFLAIGAFGLVLAAVIHLQGAALQDESATRRDDKEGNAMPSAAGDGHAGLRRDLMLLLSAPVLLCFLFYVISHIGLGGIRSFAVAALVAIYDTPLAAANGALSGFLIGTGAGILVGGVVADKLGARMLTAALGLIACAALFLLIGSVSMPIVLVVAALGASGFMRGIVQATRDLVVLSVTPKGSTGKVFAFVYNGTMIGAAIMPLFFGWMMDRGSPQGVFWLAGLFLLAALATFFGVKRSAAAASAESGKPATG